MSLQEVKTAFCAHCGELDTEEPGYFDGEFFYCSFHGELVKQSEE